MVEELYQILVQIMTDLYYLRALVSQLKLLKISCIDGKALLSLMFPSGGTGFGIKQC